MRQCWQENWEALEVMFGEDRPRSSFEEFVQEKVRRTAEGSTVTRKRLVEAYRQWCEERELEPMSEKKIAGHFPQDWSRKFDHAGCVVFCGLSLLA